MHAEHLREQFLTDPPLHGGEQPGHLGEHFCQRVLPANVPGKLDGQPGLLAAFQFRQDVLLSREVEVERAARYARLLDDDSDVGGRHAGALELRDRGGVHPLARLPALRFPVIADPAPGHLPCQLVFQFRHGGPFLRLLLDMRQ